MSLRNTAEAAFQDTKEQRHDRRPGEEAELLRHLMTTPPAP